MANFEEILNRPVSATKPPQPLPVGTYHCMVEGRPAREESSQKKTPCSVYKFKILSPGPDVDAQQAADQQVVGKYITGQGPGAAFYLTEEALWRYRQFLEDHLGIDMSGDKTWAQAEEEVNGRQCYVKIKHDISPDGTRTFHRIESTAAV